MRRKCYTLSCFCYLAVVASCTEENAIYSGDSGSTDGARESSAVDGAADGASLTDGIISGDITALCKPGAFIACKTTTVLQKCNAAGDGTISVSCSPYLCNKATASCNQCDPASAPACKGNALVSCTPNGLQVTVTCPAGCVGGACTTCTPQTFYLDGDGDGWGNPAGAFSSCTKPAGYVTNKQDCDDLDPSARPNQKAYFTSPTQGTGTYDYDCDGVAQKQHPSVGACAWKGNNCTGDGWVGAVPACGKAGQFISCHKKGGRSTGCDQSVSTRVQACR